MTAAPRPIEAAEAKALVHTGAEMAFLDVREHGQYGEGHPFLAVPCPWSRLEAAVPSLVPRRGALVLLLDDGDGIAERAAGALAALGYRDVAWVRGGAPAWDAAGFTLFKGVNVPSKTLGELLEESWHVPRITVETLADWQASGRAHALFDGRPSAEFSRTTIPGAASVPNGELPHRFAAVVGDPATPVVIHCAGRTRSIAGAAGLLLAGVPNPVFALENGTQGWALSGRELERNARPQPLPPLDETERSASAVRADAVLRRHGIPTIDAPELRRLAADPSRTLYVFDVRTAEEFVAGTVRGAVHAPAVQLAQATDGWIGVRRARVVLADDTGLRAAITAVFLKALRYDVSVLRGVDANETFGFERADGPAPFRPDLLTELAPDEVQALLTDGGIILDLRGSMAFRAGHVEGARWTIRPRLTSLALDGTSPVALVGEAAASGLVARDLSTVGVDVRGCLADDPAAWRAADLPVHATQDAPTDAEAIDFLFFVHDRHDGNMEAARRYLAWETGLTRQLDPAERDEYRIGPSPFA